MRQSILQAIALISCVVLVSCAGNRPTASAPGDYVEIDNPAATMSPDAPATIMVPRKDVESGIPRAGEILKKGTEKVLQGIGVSPEQPQPGVVGQQPVAEQASVAADRQTAPENVYPSSPPANRQTAYAAPTQPFQAKMPAAMQTAGNVKNRIAILETDRNNLVQPLYDDLRQAGVGGILDPGQSAYLAQSASLSGETEKAAFANQLQQDYGVNVVIYLSAPDGVMAGKDISAEIFDAMAGGMLQKYDGVISKDPVKDRSDHIIAVLPESFPEKIRDYLVLLPWYGRITAVEGNRAYIAAGREAGLRAGQQLKIYQGGKFMKGMGFAPGEQVGILIIQGFVGPNGSFGVIKEGRDIKATDLVSVE